MITCQGMYCYVSQEANDTQKNMNCRDGSKLKLATAYSVKRRYLPQIIFTDEFQKRKINVCHKKSCSDGNV